MPPPRPHPLARTRLVDAINRFLGQAWDKGWLDYPPLAPGALLAKGGRGLPPEAESGGRNEADVADFRLRLERLTSALETEAALNPLGRAIAHGQLARVVRQRFALGRLWHERPDLLERPLAPPILVVGQMRAGTTRVHRLLAADPAHAATRFCDSWHPVPEKPDLRPLWSSLALAGGRALNPWMDTIHPFGASRADEELGWLATTLDHCAYEAQWRVPSFSSFSEARDPTPVYREFARILSTDAAHHGNAHLPRVMKVPQFAEDLPSLLAQFPDAKIAVARREPSDVARSAVSLVANQMAMQSDQADMDWIHAEVERKIALRRSRLDEALAASDRPFAEVDFEALERDWEQVIRRVYAALDMELTGDALRAMRREQTRAARGHHQRHQRDLSGFAN